MWELKLVAIVAIGILAGSLLTVAAVLAILHRMGLLGPNRQSAPIVITAPIFPPGSAQQASMPSADAPDPGAARPSRAKPFEPLKDALQGRLTSLRIQLFQEGGREIPLVFVDGPPQGLLAGKQTALASSLAQGEVDVREGQGSRLPIFTPEVIADMHPNGALTIGREGSHVQVDVSGFDTMSRLMFEVTILNGRPHVSCRKSTGGMKVQVKVSARPEVEMDTSTPPQLITGPTQVRQLLPARVEKGLNKAGKSTPSAWYFLLTPC